MYNTEQKLLHDLLEAMCVAINNGDWTVDGACDPDNLIHKACIYLIKQGLEEPYAAMQYSFKQYFLPEDTDV